MFKGVVFLLKYVWRFEKKYVLYSLLNQMILGIVTIITLIFPKMLMDELLDKQRVEYCLLWIGIMVGGGALGRFLCNLCVGRCLVLKGSVYTQFQVYLTERLSRCDFACLEDPGFLDIKEKAQKFLYANGQGFAVVLDSVFNIIGKILVFLSIITILLTLNVWIVLFFIALVLINAKYEERTRKRYVSWDMEKVPIERRGNYLSGLVENFAFGKEIRIFGIRDWLVEKVHLHFIEANHFYKMQVKELNKATLFSSIVNSVLEGVAYVTFAMGVIYQKIGLGDFSMYVSAMMNFSNGMKDLMKSILDIRQFSGYYEALEQYMNVPVKMQEENKRTAPCQFHTIEFKNVSFRYPGQNAYSLKNINLIIRAGEKLAVVGENGAGKTTFIKLICRLYDPTEGEILLDGVDIRKMAYDSYLKLIGAVFQDFKLFAFSIKENICFGKEESNEYIAKLLEENGLEEKIATLEHGILTSVYKTFDENGFEPSGGEGQKIALTRAIYKDAPLILLDEPTSALDPKAEDELYQNFHRIIKGKTAVFISHRMSSTRFCDKIVLFESGQVAEMGTHEELMTKKGKYYDLFQMQAKYYVEKSPFTSHV